MLIFRNPPPPFRRHVKSDPNVVASGDSMKTRTHTCINMESQTLSIRELPLPPLQRKTSLSELLLSAPFRCTNYAGILSSITQHLQKFSSYVDNFYNQIAILYSSEQLFGSEVTSNLARDYGSYTVLHTL